MAEDINLLPQQGQENQGELRQKRLIKNVSVVALVLVIILVGSLFIAKFFIDSQISSVQKTIDEHTAHIDSMKKEEYTLRALSTKVTQLGTFFGTQHHYSKALDELVKTMPTSLKSTDINITDIGEVTFMGSTSSYADLAGFYAKLRLAGAPEGSTVGTYFQSPILTTVNRNDQTADVTFTIKFTLGSAVLTPAEEAAQ